MKLRKDTNYIVSGLERSGTSMLMQILNSAELPCEFDSSRRADKNNPKGYYELEGGKIINKLIDKSFPLKNYKSKFIKITAYGIKFLPPGRYNIIYTERNIEEILDSMEKMAKLSDKNRKDTKIAFLHLNKMIKKKIESREDVNCLFVNYNDILKNPLHNIKKIQDHLNISDEKINDMQAVVDKRLYRNRKK